MAFSRFGYDDSDVYTFPNQWGYECCGCCRKGHGFTTPSMRRFLIHLWRHRIMGDKVPSNVSGDVRRWEREDRNVNYS